MGYSDYLRTLLRPLGVYDLSEGSLSGSELDALGSCIALIDQFFDSPALYRDSQATDSTAP